MGGLWINEDSFVVVVGLFLKKENGCVDEEFGVDVESDNVWCEIGMGLCYVSF